MLKIGDQTVIIGGFHDHWFRNGSHNPSLLMAALNYYHYDFICLMDKSPIDAWLKSCIEAYDPNLRIFLGFEQIYGWGHVVTVHGRETQIASHDHREILRQLKRECEFVALAHPHYPVTYETIFLNGELDRLLDEGIIDAVELEIRYPEQVEWFKNRDRSGKLTPIVGGWDHHIFNPIKHLPKVLYTEEQDPSTHIDTSGGNRTLIFAEENNFPSIVRAVNNGNTVIENLHTGELVGPSRLIAELECHGYREKMEELNRKRDTITLMIDRLPVVGEPLQLDFSQPGTVMLPGTLEKPLTYATDPAGRLFIERLPPIMDRDRTHFPVVYLGEDSYKRIFAIEISHSIQLDILPKINLAEDELHAIIIHPKIPFQGNIQLTVEHIIPDGVSLDEYNLTIPFPDHSKPEQPVSYVVTATGDKGITRRQEGLLTFATAAKFTRDWSATPAVVVNTAQYVPELYSVHGANFIWLGPEHFSAEVRFAWTDQELMVRIDVIDEVVYQPFKGHFMYNGDAIQFAIDPLLRRGSTEGSIYFYGFALTSEGPEVFRYKSPLEEANDNFTPPQEDVSLGGNYLEVERTPQGLVYLLKLPWCELAPLQPQTGSQLGLYMIFHNNNGEGLVNALHWPKPIQGEFMFPELWGVLTLSY
ncbi:hypothetical protein [Cohnella silvisoli]|uniref:Carbohydrate-binding domain-containing protein n=1 Tax=Cohnella silvisoli TaxID=2873699 RepID=A0ABV1KRH0_9BACL|nr:hypothetical protein [Cohnella silvisoli]MCD9024652.1 hypothetical protein [Cohnella silvisoli]